MNKVMLLGRLTKDPEIRITENGRVLATFTLAINRKYEKDVADFLPIITFGKTAEFTEKWLKKGMQIIVVGRIQVRKWETKEGENRYSTEIIAEEVEFADSKKQEDKEEWKPADKQIDISDESELPF